MNRKYENGQRLTTWGEIADYLGVSVRTAQHWEKNRNLPVRRTPGAQRPTVVAFRSELDDWLKGEEQSAPTGGIRNSRIILAVLLVVGIGFILAYFSGWLADRDPAACAVEGNSLLVFNSKGDLLW